MRLGAQIAGRYRLVKGPIRGGTGEVWLAHDDVLGRSVVLKRVVLGDEGTAAFDRLKAEARALARFSHPNVVTLYDTVRVRTRTRVTSWLVLEHVPGGSLDRWPRISPEAAAGIGAQIGDALAALHAEGIVHCDVKPGNIVVTETGTAKLTDFGAVYRIDDRQTITPNGAISHTPAYAAPEVIRGRPEPASDVYSLGVTIGALIIGKPPVHGGVGAAPAPGRHQVADEVGPLRDVLAAMLRPAPEDRPDAAAAGRQLKEIAGTAEPPLPLHAVQTLTGQGTRSSEPVRGSAGGKATLWHDLTTFVRRRSRPIGVGVAAAALVAVLSFAPVLHDQGHHTDASHSATKPPPPRSLIGDPRTADPCALTDPGALRRFGGAKLVDDYGNFDRCDVIVDSGGGGAVDVEVAFDNEPAPNQTPTTKSAGGIGIIPDDQSEDGECSRTLLLPAPDGDTNVTITAKQIDKGSARLCAMADVATGTATAALNRGRIARRSPPIPANSLARQNACALLDAHALRVVPGVDPRQRDEGFGGWSCTWTSTTTDIQVNLRFDRNGPLDRGDGRPTRLGGYRAFVQPRGEGDDTCLVQVVYRTYIDRYGDETVEILYLDVEGAPSTARLCSMATGLAGSAATVLPHA